ncbi:MAG: hypothetical protein MUC41_14075 [Syntrophobacteraceae bacterium]|jgi:hypothetical protein|nr:hypothetical protein [Syntrophobacteraceae bacterium]
MAPEAHIAHRTAHRLRIRIPSRKGDSGYFAGLQAVLLEGGRAERVEVNPLTASVLIEASGGVDEFADPAATSQWYTLRAATPRAFPLSSKVVHGFRVVDAQIEQLTGGELDIPSIALLGLICSGIYQISIGNFAAPAWYTAFWYAASIAAKTDKPDKPGGFM